ncbi:MAG TPA: biopolymer transporter ExbD [Candidatus Limnocylindrales bacterium]|nr:biopolymer transporter ExbD [Candidatus Limnocylindrales bacterium]
MIKFTRRKRVENSLNMAPLIDMVFLLLIFFLLTSTFMRLDPGLEVNLPEAQSSHVQEAEEPVVIYLTKDNQLFLNAKPISWEDLKTYLQKSLADKPNNAVVLKADAGVPFGLFVKVMDISRQAGVLDLTVSTRIPQGFH